MLPIKVPTEIAKELALRLRQRRLDYTWTREELAKRSGVSISSLKRFELTGEISLKSFIKLCFTLRALDGFDQLLASPELRSLADLERQLKKKRKRGKRTSPI